MTEEWSAGAYIRRSDYRVDVVRILLDGPATPTDIATKCDRAQPHVSRALTELRDESLVELLVPESQTRGRYYGLTDLGRRAWERIVDEVTRLEWGWRDPEGEERALVEAVADQAGDALRTVGHYDGDRFDLLYMRDSLRETFTEDDLDDAVRTLVPTGDLTVDDDVYQVLGLDSLTLVRLFEVGGDCYHTLSFEPDYDLCTPTIVDLCREYV